MFYKKNMTFWRKWIVFMVGGITGMILAERFVGEVGESSLFSTVLWVLGGGLLLGVLMNRRSKS